MSFLKFEPTPENVKLLKAIIDLPYLTDEVAAKLLQHPLTRVGFVWSRKYHRSALSPFAYAGITKVPPQKVLEQLKAEDTFEGLELCYTVHLPVAHVSYRIQPEHWPTERLLGPFPNNYDDEVFNAAEDERVYGGSDHGRAPHSARWENRTLAHLMKRFGGKNWRRYCKRVFDPFRAPEVEDVGHITPEQWLKLKQAYYLNWSGRRKRA
jgi:hypothetical protein